MSIIKGNIPTIDLSSDTNRQIIVDRDPKRYLGHVSSALLADNTTIIAVYVLGHGRGQAIMKKSVDGGLTWSNRLSIPKSWSTLLQVPVIYRTLDTTGKERLLLFTGHYPIRMSISEDNGENWTEFEPIGDFGGNVSMSDIVQLKDNRYIGFFHDDGRFIGNDRQELRFQLYKSVSDKYSKVELYTSYLNDKNEWSIPELDERTAVADSISWSTPQLIYESYSGKKEKGNISRIYKTISEDGGMTWSKPLPIVSHKNAYLAEAGVFYSPNKKQLALLMRENTRRFNSFISFSNDEGETWSYPTEVSSELTGDRHKIRYSQDGRLVITFRDTSVNSPTHGDWVVWVGKYDDVVNGNSGEYRIRLMKNHYMDDCGYSGLELLEDGTYVATTYGHWTKDEPPYIVSIRFKLEDIEKQYLQHDSEDQRANIT